MFRSIAMGHVARFVMLCLLYLAPLSTGKRLRLPMLLRHSAIECNFTTNDCGINQQLSGFTFHHNATRPIAGICQYYIFETKDPTVLQVAKFTTTYFPKLESSVGCLHIQYNVQGESAFFLVVSERSESSPPYIIYSQRVAHSHQWTNLNIDFDFTSSTLRFIIEVICQSCSRGSSFSVSKLGLSWDRCSR